MTRQSITYAEREPLKDLQPWVQALWTFDARQLEESHYDHYVPPDGCVSLLQNVNPQQADSSLILVAPRSEPTEVAIVAGDLYHGIRFWPFAARSLLGTRLAELAGRVGPLQFFDPPLAAKIAQAMELQPTDANVRWHDAIQTVLLPELTAGSPIDDLVRRATEAIVMSRGGMALEQLADELRVSLRQLQRRFVAATGLRLKQFARIRRFREAVRELLEVGPRPWSQVAVDVGYADQSHLTREFVALIGLSPKQFQSQYEAIFHDSVEP